MPSSYGRALVAIVFAFALSFSPYAHAETPALTVNDPFVDAIQLWSAVLNSIDSFAHRLATGLASPRTASAPPYSPSAQRLAASAASALTASPAPSSTPTSSYNQHATTSLNVKSASQSASKSAPSFLPSAVFSTFPTPANYVTETELSGKLNDLRNSRCMQEPWSQCRPTQAARSIPAASFRECRR
jgi:hypothetical protein